MSFKDHLKYKIAVISVWGFNCFFTSCTGEFKDLNTNDYGVTEDMLDYDNLKVGGFITAMQRDVFPTSNTGAGDYQLAQNLTGDIFAGYMGTVNNTFKANNVYDLNHQVKWNDRAFQVAFGNVMPAWKMIMQRTEKGNIEYALAQVLKVAAMHRLADNYGPLPYKEFGKGQITTPYDALDVVYEIFFKELDEAIMIMEDFVAKTPNARPLKNYDLVYGGDFSKWLKFANSLKLRLAMRTVYVDSDKARERAAQAVSSGVMESIEDNAQLASANGLTVYHPLKKIWDDYSDTRMGANMESFLKGYDDGRISSYFRISTFKEKENGYFGVRNGINITDKKAYLPLSIPNIEAETPVRWMCVSEVYFLRAEGALRGWTEMKGEAKDLYEEGIRLSFKDWGATMRNDYLTNDSYLPAEYIDQVATNHIRKGDPKLSVITIPWKESVGFDEENLERIITQKWIAMYPDGQEAWSEFRRTRYPKVFPVIVNNSGGEISTETQVRRITFPQSEYDNNEVEVIKAVSLLGGPDSGGTKLWWDKK